MTGVQRAVALCRNEEAGVQRAQGLGDPARSPLPGSGAAHLGDAIAGPHKFPFVFLAAAGG
jgi:hypothetical protein